MTQDVDQWRVTFRWQGHTMERLFDYLPYAEKQADTWRRLYPEAEIEIVYNK